MLQDKEKNLILPSFPEAKQMDKGKLLTLVGSNQLKDGKITSTKVGRRKNRK